MAQSTKKLYRKILFIILAVSAFVIGSVFFVFNSSHEAEKNVSTMNLEHQKIELGRMLFFDKRLSGDNSIACVSCHKPQLAFTDGQQFPSGVEGRVGFRNTPTILNLSNATSFMFDAEIKSLEEQAIVPIQDHAEMDIAMGDLIKKLKAIPKYNNAAKKIYGKEFDASVLTKSLAAFERSLIAQNSKFDRFINSGDTSLLTKKELDGWELFNEFNCISCHSLPNFTNSKAANVGFSTFQKEDLGRFRVTHDSLDIGRFKVPSLRNITLTAPYLHDGSVNSLADVFPHGNFNEKTPPNFDLRLRNRDLTQNEKKNILFFLETLIDTSYMVKFR